VGRPVAHEEVDRDGDSRTERAEHDKHRERDGLPTGARAGVSDCRRGADRQDEVLGLILESASAIAAERVGVKRSMVSIHFGSEASVSRRGRPRH
jgi:hypothetical protein